MEEETGTGDDVSLQKEEGGRRQDDGVQKSSHWLWDVFQAFQAREELKSFLVMYSQNYTGSFRMNNRKTKTSL